jgi:hypothetical protein
MPFSKGTENRGQKVVRHHWNKGHAQIADCPVAGALGGRDSSICLRYGSLGFVQEYPTGLGQAHHSPRTLQQHHAQFIFDPPNGGAQRRLRHVQPLRGSSEAHLFRHGNELAELAQINHVILKMYQIIRNIIIEVSSSACKHQASPAGDGTVAQ